MTDVNRLKYINDTFGHEKGDEYIKGCSGLIQSKIRNSPIYRNGGDEFCIILKGADFENREKLFDGLIQAFKDAWENESAKPWERYSLSLGMADYEAGDKTHDVMKRADLAMYESKLAFRRKNGILR